MVVEKETAYGGKNRLAEDHECANGGKYWKWMVKFLRIRHVKAWRVEKTEWCEKCTTRSTEMSLSSRKDHRPLRSSAVGMVVKKRCKLLYRLPRMDNRVVVEKKRVGTCAIRHGPVVAARETGVARGFEVKRARIPCHEFSRRRRRRVVHHNHMWLVAACPPQRIETVAEEMIALVGKNDDIDVEKISHDVLRQRIVARVFVRQMVAQLGMHGQWSIAHDYCEKKEGAGLDGLEVGP